MDICVTVNNIGTIMTNLNIVLGGFIWRDMMVSDSYFLMFPYSKSCHWNRFELPDPLTDASLLVATSLTSLLLPMYSICTWEVIMLSSVWEVWNYEMYACVILVFIFEVFWVSFLFTPFRIFWSPALFLRLW